MLLQLSRLSSVLDLTTTNNKRDGKTPCNSDVYTISNHAGRQIKIYYSKE
jgi:hypothetical protein